MERMLVDIGGLSLLEVIVLIESKLPGIFSCMMTSFREVERVDGCSHGFPIVHKRVINFNCYTFLESVTPIKVLVSFQNKL